jgi:hypothetical protein
MYDAPTRTQYDPNRSLGGAGNGALAGVPVKETPFASELNSTIELISQVEQRLATLGARLAPVSASVPPPTEAPGTNDRTGNAPFVDVMIQCNRRLANVREQIDYIMHGLQV